MKSGILSTALFIVFLEMRIGERLRLIMWWKKKNIKDKRESASGKIANGSISLTIDTEHSRSINYSCLKCRYQIKVPKDYIDQFKPGGKEYHLDGHSYLHCPKCAEMIEIK